ncbi:MAG: hypothetical protein WBK91_06710 [Alphaproteobacteria bacterium]
MMNRKPGSTYTIVQQFIAAGALLLSSTAAPALSQVLASPDPNEAATALDKIPVPDSYELTQGPLPLTPVVQPYRSATLLEFKQWALGKGPTSPAGLARTAAQSKMGMALSLSGKKECLLVYVDKDRTQMMNGMLPFLLQREAAHYAAAAYTPPSPLIEAAYFCGKAAVEHINKQGQKSPTTPIPSAANPPPTFMTPSPSSGMTPR